MIHPSLITIPSTRIVPTPLHLFLGIGNRIITTIFVNFFGGIEVMDAIRAVKSKHTRGCGGLSDLYDLNGQEIRRWIKHAYSDRLINRSVFTDYRQIRRIARWLVELPEFLLNTKPYTRETAMQFQDFQQEVWRCWTAVTDQKPFPKIHMLFHAMEFYHDHGILGQVAESQIESYHALFNRLFYNRHLNSSHVPAERLNRTLRDCTLQLIQPWI